MSAAYLSCLLVALVFTPARGTAEGPPRPVVVVGYFSNMTHSGEHGYGYAVQLWRQSGKLLGLFLASEGLEGDTPCGLLEDAQYDPRSGAVSFRARLSVGVLYSKKHQGVPSRDLFEFSGVLSKTRLRGTVTRSNALEPGEEVRIQKVILLRSDSSEDMQDVQSQAEWRRSMDEILKARGPKW